MFQTTNQMMSYFRILIDARSTFLDCGGCLLAARMEAAGSTEAKLAYTSQIIHGAAI